MEADQRLPGRLQGRLAGVLRPNGPNPAAPEWVRDDGLTSSRHWSCYGATYIHSGYEPQLFSQLKALVID
jgi:hypothetical protein